MRRATRNQIVDVFVLPTYSKRGVWIAWKSGKNCDEWKEGRGRGSCGRERWGRGGGGRRRPRRSARAPTAADKHQASLLYRCSTECNLPRNLCTGMRQTSRNERFILAHARMQRYFVLIRRPGARHHRHHALAYMNRTQRITREGNITSGGGGGVRGEGLSNVTRGFQFIEEVYTAAI